MKQINPTLELASGEYDTEKARCRGIGNGHRVTIRIIERRFKLKAGSLINYRANYLSRRDRKVHA